jgi:transposase-like protein
VFLAGRIDIVPKPFPKEFRRDVIAVARQGDQSIAAVARNFGISESCLSRWLEIADREDGITSSAIDAPARAGRGRPGGGEPGAAQTRQATRAGERDPAP